MNFFGTLFAVLLALYLTGNVQEGSFLYDLVAHGVIRDVLLFGGFAVVGVFGFVAILMIRHYRIHPRALWDDFKSGKLKF